MQNPLDLDQDGLVDYIVGNDWILGEEIYILLGGCQQLNYGYDLKEYFSDQDNCVDRGFGGGGNDCEDCSNFAQVYSNISRYQDWRGTNQKLALKTDTTSAERIGAVIGNMDGLFYYEDIRLGYGSNRQENTFSEFFMDFSRAINTGAIIALILCVIMIFFSFETPKEEALQKTENVKKLQKMVKIAALLLFITQLIITIYIMGIVNVRVEFSAFYVGPQASLIAFILIYPAAWLLFALLPFIYMKVAPYYAEKTYINLQHRMMRKWQKMNKKEYEVIVTQMDNRKDVSILTYINRALLPVLMSFTIGITIYQGLANGGLLTSIIQTFDPYFIPKTHPENLGIIQQEVSFEHIWVEMGKFATYCVLPMVVTFFFTSMLIPSSWLLDDAGVAYYIRNLKQRSINDVESISSWLLKIVGGFFGMSAILSFISLFNPFFGQVDALAAAIEGNIENTNGGLGVAIFVLTLILFPLIMSFALMTACITKIEENIHPLSAELFIRMEKKGLDVTPVEIAAVLNAHVGDKPWTEGRQDDISGDERTESILKIASTKKMALSDENKSAIAKEIDIGLLEIPEEIGKMDFEEALNIVRGKINQAFQFGFEETMTNLNVLKTKILGLQDVYTDLAQKLEISIETMSNKLKLPIENLMSIIQPIVGSIPELSLEMGLLKVQIKQAPIGADEIDKSAALAMKQSQLIAYLSNLFMSLYMLISA